MEGDNIKKTKEEYQQIIVNIQAVRNEVAEAELYESMHLLGDVLNKIGWEVAEKLTGKKQPQPSFKARAYPHDANF